MLSKLLHLPTSRENNRQTSEERELVKCTFKPEIISKSVSKGDRCLELFNHSKYRSSEKKRDKSTVDYEYEK